MKYQVLYEAVPPWLVAESQELRKPRVAAGDAGRLADWHPGSYPGRVVSVHSLDKPFTPADTFDPSRRLAEMDLDPGQLRSLSTRRSRLAPGVLGVLAVEAVSFDERWGAVASPLRKAFPDPEDLEAHEDELFDASLARNHEAARRNDAARELYLADLDAYRREVVAADELDSLYAGCRPQPPVPEPFEELHERIFRNTAHRLVKRLAPNTVHTGAGVYKVDGLGSTHNDTIAGFRENLTRYSEQLENALWYTDGFQGTVTPNVATWITGDVVADKLGKKAGDTETSRYWYGTDVTLDDNTDYAFSMYVKKDAVTHVYITTRSKGGGLTTTWFNLDTGVVGTAGHAVYAITDEGSGWYRIQVTFNSGVGATVPYGVFGVSDSDGATTVAGLSTGDGNYFCGLQLEAGASASEYIPTTVASMHAVLLTTGGLVEDERNGEVLVTGGNSYPVIKAYAAQVNVVGDPTAEAGALTISPYTTVQSAADQLWTDQAAVNFAATQTISMYDGTYTEDVVFNAGLKPVGQFPLVIKAASGQTAVTVTNVASHTIEMSLVTNVIVEGLGLAGSTDNKYILRNLGYGCRVTGCSFDGGNTGARGGNGYVGDTWLRDCTFTGFPAGEEYHWIYAGTIERCEFHGGAYIYLDAAWTAESCVFDGAQILHSASQPSPGGQRPSKLVNCTFYNSPYALQFTSPVQFGRMTLVARNNVFHTITNCVFHNIGAAIIDSDRNCFYTIAKYAEVGGVDYTTFANWQAFTDDDGNSPDARSIEVDPELTDPAADDFSLAAGSPCRHTGAGAGAETDLDGDALSPTAPDIGCQSTGATATPPTVSTSVSGTTVTVTLSGPEGRYRVRLATVLGVQEAESSRWGAGDVQFTSVASGHHRVIAWPVTLDDLPAGEPTSAADAWVDPAGAVTASGPLSLPVENLRILLSNSPDFRTLVGAADAAGALGYIHYPYRDATDYARPLALLEGCEAWNARLEAHGAQGTYLHDGEIALTLERDVDSAYQAKGEERDAYLAFTNVVGAIVADLEANAVPYLDVRTVRFADRPRRVTREDQAQGRDYYRAVLIVEWGGE